MNNILSCLRKKENITKVILLFFSLILVVVDQIFKVLAVDNLKPIATMPIINDFFHLTYVENKGAAFNILDGQGLILVILTSIIIIGLIYLIVTNKFKSTLVSFSFALFIGGGLGNLVDRIVRHYVIDYLDFRFIHFAVFNFADCCVVIGAVLLLISIFVGTEHKDRKTLKFKDKVVENNE